MMACLTFVLTEWPSVEVGLGSKPSWRLGVDDSGACQVGAGVLPFEDEQPHGLAVLYTLLEEEPPRLLSLPRCLRSPGSDGSGDASCKGEAE
jgi:hypothetical protein